MIQHDHCSMYISGSIQSNSAHKTVTESINYLHFKADDIFHQLQ